MKPERIQAQNASAVVKSNRISRLLKGAFEFIRGFFALFSKFVLDVWVPETEGGEPQNPVHEGSDRNSVN